MLCKLEIVKVKMYLQNSNKKFNKTMEEKIVAQKNTQSHGTYIHCPGTDFQRNYMTLQRKLFKFI